MTPRPARRGFTLLELVIALGASAFVIVGAVAAALSQQTAYLRSAQIRGAHANARAAELFIQEKLAVAGLGMDPALALDFQFYTLANYGFPCPAENGGCPRDATTNNDELVFYARNPSYWVTRSALSGPGVANPVGHAWRILGTAEGYNAVSSTGIDVWAHQGDVFRKGQILLAVCPDGQYYTYMTVGATSDPIAADGAYTISLAGADASNPFKRQDLALASTAADPPVYYGATGVATGAAIKPAKCYGTGQARLFQIDRYRFHVRPVPAATPGGAGYDPYLVLDMGVDTNGDKNVDVKDEYVIAQGVEVLQVAYAMASTALPTPVVGARAGTAISFNAGLPGSTTNSDEITTNLLTPTLPLAYSYAPAINTYDNAYAAWSWYSYSLSPDVGSPRLTDAQGNVRAVIVSMVVRSPEQDIQMPATSPYTFGFSYQNMNRLPAWISSSTPAVGGPLSDGYQRVQVSFSVPLPNMTARGMSYF